MIFENQLKHWKQIPVCASSAKEALKILVEQPSFDLVMTDMQMPEMDGIELAQSIRLQYPNLPII